VVHFVPLEFDMSKRQPKSLILTSAVLLVAFNCAWPGCSGQVATFPVKTGHSQVHGGGAMPFSLTSTAFANGGEIPKRYTCDGADHSPALNWSDVPTGAQSLALIADDPDAPVGTWTHWILWNIPAKATALPEGAAKVELLDNGAHQGRNDFKHVGYGGPCPPAGKPHRYFFKLYALDARLDVKAGAGRHELELAMKPHVLSQAEWMGTYRR
jgi:Raf kinase inhibitor-like YbhB/YbcL family protein